MYAGISKVNGEVSVNMSMPKSISKKEFENVASNSLNVLIRVVISRVIGEAYSKFLG